MVLIALAMVVNYLTSKWKKVCVFVKIAIKIGIDKPHHMVLVYMIWYAASAYNGGIKHWWYWWMPRASVGFCIGD